MKPRCVSTVTASLIIAFAFVVPSQAAKVAADDLFLVKDGKPRSVIVAPTPPSRQFRYAVEELQYHLNRASGVTLPIVKQDEARALSAETLRFFFEVDKDLPEETFQVKTQGNTLTFTGDGRNHSTVQWAVDHFLDTQLGVRWLWPGDVGTHVPRHTTIPVPQLNYTGRPILEQRRLRTSLTRRSYTDSPLLLTKPEYEQLVKETQNWLRRFQSGNRTHYYFDHGFGHWWEKYSQSHPDYFAVPPVGSKYRQPYPRAERVKLRLGNEAIDDAIIAEWKAAGAPDVWNVCPNDGSGFDTSDVTRALDDPPNQDPELIWRTANANLTTRYVKFWNRLIVKMKKTNPDVEISSFAYSAYLNPPLHGLKLQPGVVLELVPNYWAQDDWRAWQEAGARLLLRPNWWIAGGVAPLVPLHQQGNFFKFAQEHKMAGFDSDSLFGYWATQGPKYYVIARLMVRPDLSVDEIIDEYCSAFGEASPDIKAYWDYWENFTMEAGYPAPAGGTAKPFKPGLVSNLVKQHKLSAVPSVQGWQLIPYLYTDDVLNKGHWFLDQADQRAGGDEPFVKQRIQFLRDGLVHLKLTRDVLQLGYLKQRTAEQQDEYKKLSARLMQMRKTLSPRHVVWGEVEYAFEVSRSAPTLAEGTLKEIEDLPGTE